MRGAHTKAPMIVEVVPLSRSSKDAYWHRWVHHEVRCQQSIAVIRSSPEKHAEHGVIDSLSFFASTPHLDAARQSTFGDSRLMSKRLNESEVPLSAKKLKVSIQEVVIEQKTMQLDEDLHSRQLAVYGRASMRRMAASDILICGMLGLGVETGDHVIFMAC